MTKETPSVYRYYRWVVEWHTPYSALISVVSDVLYSGRSRYQDIEISISPDMGKMLILDGKLQSAEKDEFIYHEMLVHPALITHGNPKRVLIIGGGEGATLREVLRYSSVEEAVMVDLDEEVIKASKEFLPEFHRGSFDDRRAKLVISDGREFLRKYDGEFDAIIVDVTDPTTEGPSRLLYTIEFYKLAASKLSDEGVLVTQATSTFYNIETFSVIVNTMRRVFTHVRPYQASVPSFISDWGFVIGSFGRDPISVSGEEAAERARSQGLSGLLYYEPERHPHYFWLPPYVRRVVEEEKRIATDDSPVKVF